MEIPRNTYSEGNKNALGHIVKVVPPTITNRHPVYRVQGQKSLAANRDSIWVVLMQSYENKPKESSLGKRILLDFIDFLRYKIENDMLTLEEIDSMARVIEDNIILYGTSEDFARFYGRSKDNVKVVLSRKMPVPPKRRVFYPYNIFRKIVPSSWKLHSKL